MANASRKQMGAGALDKGKGDGSGARASRPADLPENSPLSNRDKARHSDARGQDTKWVQAAQEFGSQSNQRPPHRKRDDAAE